MYKTGLEKGKEFEPDIFLLEGTAFSFDEEETGEELTEREMHDKWNDLLNRNKQDIIFVNTYIRDTIRLRNLAAITQTNHRQIVLEPRYAYLLDKYTDYSDFLVLKELDTKEHYKKNWITLEDIQSEPWKYILQNSFENRSFMENFKKGIYCHSNGEPLGDYDVRYQVMISTVEENHFSFEDFNVSGHATKEDLIAIAKAVDAKSTIPWHSFKPEKLLEGLATVGLSTFLPEKDTVYSLDRLNKNVVR